jgi:hypothetical protein
MLRTAAQRPGLEAYAPCDEIVRHVSLVNHVIASERAKRGDGRQNDRHDLDCPTRHHGDSLSPPRITRQKFPRSVILIYNTHRGCAVPIPV